MDANRDLCSGRPLPTPDSRFPMEDDREIRRRAPHRERWVLRGDSSLSEPPFPLVHRLSRHFRVTAIIASCAQGSRKSVRSVDSVEEPP